MNFCKKSVFEVLKLIGVFGGEMGAKTFLEINFHSFLD